MPAFTSQPTHWYIISDNRARILIISALLLLTPVCFAFFAYLIPVLAASFLVSFLFLAGAGLLLGIQLALLFASLNKLAGPLYLLSAAIFSYAITLLLPVLAIVLPVEIPAFLIFLLLGVILIIMQFAILSYMRDEDAAAALVHTEERTLEKAKEGPQADNQLSVSPIVTKENKLEVDNSEAIIIETLNLTEKKNTSGVGEQESSEPSSNLTDPRFRGEDDQKGNSETVSFSAPTSAQHSNPQVNVESKFVAGDAQLDQAVPIPGSTSVFTYESASTEGFFKLLANKVSSLADRTSSEISSPQRLLLDCCKVISSSSYISNSSNSESSGSEQNSASGLRIFIEHFGEVEKAFGVWKAENPNDSQRVAIATSLDNYKAALIAQACINSAYSTNYEKQFKNLIKDASPQVQQQVNEHLTATIEKLRPGDGQTKNATEIVRLGQLCEEHFKPQAFSLTS